MEKVSDIDFRVLMNDMIVQTLGHDGASFLQGSDILVNASSCVIQEGSNHLTDPPRSYAIPPSSDNLIVKIGFNNGLYMFLIYRNDCWNVPPMHEFFTFSGSYEDILYDMKDLIEVFNQTKRDMIKESKEKRHDRHDFVVYNKLREKYASKNQPH